MRAIDPNSETTPELTELELPRPAADEVLVEVHAAGINHADLMQLRGAYPPPHGESEIPGLELSGVVRAVGEGVHAFAPGDRVMALTAGGAHAEWAAVPAGQLMPLPETLSFVEGAAIPEAGLTAWTNLVHEGGLESGETVLITGATGGMGRTMVQLAHLLGAGVLAAGRSLERLQSLRDLGADALLEIGDGFADRLRGANGGRGVDLALELVGGEQLPQTLAALNRKGRCVLVGLLAGRQAELDLRTVLSRHLRVIGSTLRSRSRAEKAELVAAFSNFALPRIADGRLRPQVVRVFLLRQVADAYEALRTGSAQGKVVMVTDSGAELRHQAVGGEAVVQAEGEAWD